MKDFDQALADLIIEHIGEGYEALIAAMETQIIALTDHEARGEARHSLTAAGDGSAAAHWGCGCCITHQSATKTTFLLYKATVSAIGVG